MATWMKTRAHREGMLTEVTAAMDKSLLPSVILNKLSSDLPLASVDMLLLRSQDRMKRKEVDKEKEKEKETPGLRGVKKVELVEVFDGKTAESKTTKKMKYEDLEEVRRQEVFADMARIEREFEEIKDQMYAEKIQALQTECRSIMDGTFEPIQQRSLTVVTQIVGTHESFIARVGDLEKTKEQKAWLAQRWKEYQLMNIENVYLAECRQAEDEYNVIQLPNLSLHPSNHITGRKASSEGQNDQ